MLAITTNIDEQRMSDIVGALNALGAGEMPHTARSVRDATELIQQRWIDNSKGAFKHTRGKYMEGIENGMMYPFGGNIYHGAVINTSDHAGAIEDGVKAYDMKDMLNTSKKVRISKAGKKYLIIPFRHGAPGTVTIAPMPKQIHSMVTQESFTHSKVTGIRQEPVVNGAKGETVGRNVYKNPDGSSSWGSRLSQKDITKAGGDKSSRYAGMVRFPRNGGGSKFLTFRVMHQDSKGWMHPGTEGKHLAQRTYDEVQGQVSNVINNGVEADLREMGLA